jgi:heme-degrading monooxygenase HmoA
MKAGPFLFMALLSFLSGCAFTAPYRRMGAAQTGALAADHMAVVTLSAVEHQPGKRKPFFDDTKRVFADLPNQEGLLGYSFRFQFFGNKAWTMTAWEDEASRDRFARSPVHLAAVRNSRTTAQNMRFISVEVPASSLPLSWREALKHLEAAPGYEQRPHAASQ